MFLQFLAKQPYTQHLLDISTPTHVFDLLKRSSHSPGGSRQQHQQFWDGSHHLTVVAVVSLGSPSSSNTHHTNLKVELHTHTNSQPPPMVAGGDEIRQRHRKVEGTTAGGRICDDSHHLTVVTMVSFCLFVRIDHNGSSEAAT